MAALVTANSPADLEARSRGASLYLPEGTVPMLPSAAVERLGLGLQPVSPALSIGVVVGENGEIEDVEVTASHVRVTRLSYPAAESRLHESSFVPLVDAAQRYAARRQENQAVIINLPEVRINVQDGRVILKPLLRLRSRQLVRDAMLIAGEAVALFALQNELAIPFTVQDPPKGPITPGDTPSVMFARRRLMQPSRPSGTAGAHAGLGMSRYVQATSPLRRYLDLVTHQQLRAFAAGGETLDKQAIMARIGAVSATAGDVRWAERQSNRHWTLVYLLQNPDWSGEGIVVEKRGRNSHLLIPDLGFETSTYLAGATLDQVVELTVRDIDLPQLEGNFSVAQV